MRINLNQIVTVRLSITGLKIYEKYHRDLGVEPPRLQDQDVWKGQLWELANIFGKNLYNGCVMPFESAVIEVVGGGE